MPRHQNENKMKMKISINFVVENKENKDYGCLNQYGRAKEEKRKEKKGMNSEMRLLYCSFYGGISFPFKQKLDNRK